MTANLGWGMLFIIAGLLVISFRHLFILSSAEVVSPKQGRLTTPTSTYPINSRGAQLALVGALIIVLLGILAILRLSPFS